MFFQYRSYFLILLILLPLPALSQQVTRSVDRDSISVGDEVRYKLTVPRSSGVDEVIYPGNSDFGNDFDVTGQDTFSGAHSDSAVYTLQYFGSDDATMPEVPVGLVSGRDTLWLSAPPLSMEFTSRVDDESGSFRPFKPLYEFSLSVLPFIIAALLLALLAGLAWRYYRNREVEEKPIAEPKAPPLFKDPLATLEQELELVKAEYSHPEEDIKGYYLRLGNAIRSYFEELYDIPALESTTAELANELRDELVDNALRYPTLLLLQQADMVKFAKFRPGRDQCIKAMQEADNFLTEARRIDGPRVRSMKTRHDEFYQKLAEGENQTA
ncbi:MAG: hypothetical protein WEB89_10240 [Balneolales bacterium]